MYCDDDELLEEAGEPVEPVGDDDDCCSEL